MKQYLVIFLVCFISLFFLGNGVLGSNGFLYNREIKKQILETQISKEKLEHDIASLQEEKAHLASEDGLRDLAIDLGYYVEGDTVYLFNEPSLQSDVNNNTSSDGSISFTPFPSSLILLIDFGVSCIITFVILFLSRNKKTSNTNDFYGDEISDSDIYINA